jgi:hypothetical protein
MTDLLLHIVLHRLVE